MNFLKSYRQKIEKKTKNIFVKCLKLALKDIDKQKFGFIGIVGSLKKPYSHDIDLLIFPSKNVKLGESIIELTKLYDFTEKNLRKYHERYYLATSPKFAMQDLTYYLASIEEGPLGLIPIHSMFFTNYRDFKRFSPKYFQQRIKKTLITLHGNFNNLKKLPELSQEKLEPYFFILDFEMTSRIRTFPNHLIRTSAESLFSYLNEKYHLNIKKHSIHDIKKIEKEFLKTLKVLDKITYSKNN